MRDEGGPSAPRKPRADAVRNRLRLLATAKAVFAEKGSDASLDEIAQIAGVGAGTLYRHFPTRDALVRAVYRNETEQLVVAADRLTESRPPVDALREWLLLFFDYIATKHGMQELLSSILDGAADLRSESIMQVDKAVSKVVGGAVANGDIRPDIDPKDLLFALAGVAKFGSGADREQTARRLVDILIKGVQIQK